MNQNCTIREIISEERPYEKCEQYGAGNLTDVELLAILHAHRDKRTQRAGTGPERFCIRFIGRMEFKYSSLDDGTTDADQRNWKD